MRRALVFLAACGSSHTPAPDAADPRGEVYVKVVRDDGTGKPELGAQVVISEPDGSMYEIVTTDATGLATGHLLPGGSLTKVPIGSEFQMWTVLAVDPGDHVTLGPEPAPPAFPGGAVTVAFPYPDAQAVSHGVSTSCSPLANASASPATTPTLAPCSMIQAMAIAQGSADVIASTWSAAQPYTDGATLTTQSTWQPVDTLTVTISNVPTNLQWLFVDQFVGAGSYAATNELGQVKAPTTSDQTVTLTHVYGPQALYTATLEKAGTDEQFATLPIDPNATSLQIDAANAFMPMLDLLHYDAANRTLHESASPPPQPTIVRSEIAWNIGMQNYVWHVYSATLGDLALPEVASPALPPASASGTLEVTMCLTDGIASYADARHHPDSSFQTCAGSFGAAGSSWQLTSTSGTFP